jgi:hypothetical protein
MSLSVTVESCNPIMEDTVLSGIPSIQTQDGRTVDLDRWLAEHPVFLIGSDPRAALQVTDAAPAHAVIIRHGNQCFVEPRLPHLQISVNDRVIRSQTALMPGDVLTVADTRITYSLREGHPVAAPVRPRPTPTPTITAAKPVVTLPASAITKRSSTVATSEIFYPKTQTDLGKGSFSLFGILSVLAIVALVAVGVLSASNGTQAASRAGVEDFAFGDGTVTLVMFDADW